jgi:cell division protein ZapA (FtsZ GTPase activity inhibitor)
MKAIEVEIFNTRFAVCEHENEDYLQALAAKVDARVHQIFASSQHISPLRAALMAAYLFADEAQQHRRKNVAEKVT